MLLDRSAVGGVPAPGPDAAAIVRIQSFLLTTLSAAIDARDSGGMGRARCVRDLLVAYAERTGSVSPSRLTAARSTACSASASPKDGTLPPLPPPQFGIITIRFRGKRVFEVTAPVNAGDTLTRVARVGFVGDPLPPAFASEAVLYL